MPSVSPYSSAKKRARIVETAERLVHERGFGATTLADIAHASGVPLGNLYYYFKTKDAIGEALVDRLGARHEEIRRAWDESLPPVGRVLAFIEASLETRESLARSGCAIGGLCSELHKEPGPLAARAATLFDAFLGWLTTQFKLMGKGAESRELAFHLVSSLQGAALLANTFHDTKQLARECKRLMAWTYSLAAED